MINYIKIGMFVAILSLTVDCQTTQFDVHVAELNGIRMVSTSDKNYAITSPTFNQNWRTVSVNGDDIIIATKDNNIYTKTLTTLSEPERNELLKTKSQVSEVIQYNGINNGGLSSSFSSINLNNNNLGNQQAKYTTYSSSGSHMSSSSSSSASIGGSNQMSHYTINDISFSMNNDNDFAVYKKDKMPFNWSRVFVNGDLLTIVLNNGQVYMKPIEVASQEEMKQLELLRTELKSVAQLQQQQFSQTMQNSMDMMHKIMGNNFQPNHQMIPRPPYHQMNNQYLPTVPLNPMSSMSTLSSTDPINPMTQMNPFNPQQFQQQLNQHILYQQQLLQQQIFQQQQNQHYFNNNNNYQNAQNNPIVQLTRDNMLNSYANLAPSIQYPLYRVSNPIYRQTSQIQTNRNFPFSQPTQEQQYINNETNFLRQTPDRSYNPGNMLNQFNPAISATSATGSFAGPGSGMFGNNFPFGPNNSPFGNGFPFNQNGVSAFATAGR